MKKFLTGILIGAFVFGVGAANVQPVSAATLDKVKETKEKYDNAKEKFGQMRDGDNSNRPEPPKDSNGKPTAPPDGDNSNRPEPPKDSNGNPMPPPDGDNSNRPEPPKDSNGNPMAPPDKNSNDKISDAKDKYDKAKDIFKK